MSQNSCFSEKLENDSKKVPQGEKDDDFSL